MIYSENNKTIVLIFAVILALVLSAVASGGGGGQGAEMIAVVGIFGLVVAAMSRLAVSVDHHNLSVSLGLGLFKRAYDLSSLRSCHAINIENPFSVGFRLLPDGWLYSIGGKQFVRLAFADGSELLLGVESSNTLIQAIESKVPRS